MSAEPDSQTIRPHLVTLHAVLAGSSLALIVGLLSAPGWGPMLEKALYATVLSLVVNAGYYIIEADRGLPRFEAGWVTKVCGYAHALGMACIILAVGFCVAHMSTGAALLLVSSALFFVLVHGRLRNKQKRDILRRFEELGKTWDDLESQLARVASTDPQGVEATNIKSKMDTVRAQFATLMEDVHWYVFAAPFGAPALMARPVIPRTLDEAIALFKANQPDPQKTV
jgi:hypothetical protein